MKKLMVDLFVAVMLVCGLSACADERANTSSDSTESSSKSSPQPSEKPTSPDQSKKNGLDINGIENEPL